MTREPLSLICVAVLSIWLAEVRPVFAADGEARDAVAAAPSSGNSNASAESPKPQRRFTLSTGYLDQSFHSNEGISEFPLTMLDGYGYLYDQVFQSWGSTPWKRALAFVISAPVAEWFTTGLSLGFHEFGHARSVRALGGQYFYTVPYYGQLNVSNYWSLSLWLLITPPSFLGGSVPFTNYFSGLRVPAGTEPYYGRGVADLLTAGAGINNSTLLANRMAQRAFRGGMHVANWEAYYTTKLDGMLYALLTDPGRTGNDISSLVSGYRTKGYPISSSTIAGQYALGLLSGTSLGIIKGIYDYIAHGDSVVRPLEWKGIRFPELSSYANARGLSFEVATSFRFSETFIADLAYEWITVGDLTQQLTPRLNFELASVFPTLNSLWLSLEGVIGTGFGQSVEAEWRPQPSSGRFFSQLSYGLKWTNYSRYTLYGERNSPDLTVGDNVSQVLASVRFHY